MPSYECGELYWSDPKPRHETVTLDDYRRRHALHRSDAGLQALSAAAPLIAMWDDHEIANNEWMRGAEDHQPATEGRAWQILPTTS